VQESCSRYVWSCVFCHVCRNHVENTVPSMPATKIPHTCQKTQFLICLLHKSHIHARKHSSKHACYTNPAYLPENTVPNMPTTQIPHTWQKTQFLICLLHKSHIHARKHSSKHACYTNLAYMPENTVPNMSATQILHTCQKTRKEQGTW